MQFTPRNIRKKKGFAFSDFYQLLGVDRNAGNEAIKRAYRKKALIYHPDRNRTPEAAERFRMLKEACDTLSDPERRKKYDMWLDHGVSLAIYRAWQQARSNNHRYRTGGFRRKKRRTNGYGIRREGLSWLVNLLLITMVMICCYTLVVSFTDASRNGYNTEQLQLITFSGGFIALIVVLGVERQKRQKRSA